ncbi:MAG: hypothetical protein KAY37_09550 [Phycisphaerae bacterium]|nr:hypothetical protein [Phycisphaerae bacterium]
MTVEYTFDRPVISEVKLGGQLYDRVTMAGAPNGGNAGQPALPACGARVLLPFGTEVSSVAIVPSERVPLGTGYFIEPVSEPVKLPPDSDAARPPTPDVAIYGSDQPFPGGRSETIGTHGFRGYQILTLKLQPVEYLPASGTLYYYPRLTVVVNTVDTGQAAPLLRGLAIDEAEVLERVDNPAIVESYAAAGIRGARNFDLLILTTPTLAGGFQPLKNHHDAHGIATEIHTTTDVGSSDPDDVRAYITDRYVNDGIQYVIIGGDDDVIPAKDLYVEISPGGEAEYSMPGDIYFACLDGTWNYDGDGYWGEPTDGPGGGDVDLVAEVYVGRASAGNATEVARFVNKTIWYLTNQHSQIEQVLLVGEYLGFGGPAEYAGDTLEELIDGSSAHGYTTVGIPSSEYTIDELFERDWPGNSWPQSELVTRINSGLHILNHLGHGSPDYAMKLYNSDVTSQLTNTDLCFVYSQTCSAGRFDGTDCWAETANLKTDHAAFAVIMNARYGFGEYYSTDGPSQRFNREFWDAIFNPVENKGELGRANQDSKEDNLYRVNEDCMRWCYYELTLFGDPTVAINEVTGLRVIPGSELVSEGPGGGPFVPDSKVYTLENMGPGALNYEVNTATTWLTITNGAGALPNVGDTADVTVTINAEADSLPDGVYDAVVSFINTTDHVGDTTRGVTLKVGIPQIAYEWPLDTNPGWTTEGQWAYGQPTGGGGEYGGPDPTSGYTGANVYGYNLNGDYPNSMTETHLTSTAIDCTGLFDVHLTFWRWLGVEQPAYDHAYVRVSNNGLNWTTVWQNTTEVADYSWTPLDLDISDVADDQSTVYLRWTMGETDSGWRYCGWNIDDIQLIALGGEEPPLSILLPDGLPENLEPGVPQPITVQIVDGAETYVPGSGLLHYRYDGGSYLTAPLTPLGGNLYQATLPAAGCQATPEYYFSADGAGGSTVFNPKDAPNTVYTAVVGTLTIIMADNFETDQGWTAENLGATSGDWQRGVPVNDPSWDYDPLTDSDGSGQCYLTQNEMGNTDVDDGAVRLSSPIIDMSGGGITISYDYYLYLTNTGGSVDMLLVEINSNGGVGSWIEIARHTSNGGLNWRSHVIDQAVLDAAGVVLTDQMQLRFTANDADAQSINESGLDAFLVTGFICEAPPGCDGDSNCDDQIDWRDIDYFVAAMNDNVAAWEEMFLPGTPTCPFENNDVNGDATVNWRDIDQLVALMNTTCP